MKDNKKKTPWLYSDTVQQHFFRPKNFLKENEVPMLKSEKPSKNKDEKVFYYNAIGEAGNPICGDLMKFWLWIDLKTEKIKKCRWQTFGCGSAIASTSMLSVMITENGGLTLEEAKDIKPKDILARLGGLPVQKIHCSVLGDQALRKAIENYNTNH